MSSVTVPPVCPSVHYPCLSSSTLKDNFFLDESVKPDRPETPAEAKLIGKEFGDFLNLKVKEFWDNVNIKVKRTSGISKPLPTTVFFQYKLDFTP